MRWMECSDLKMLTSALTIAPSPVLDGGWPVSVLTNPS